MPLYPALRPLLFRLDPETSHGLGIAALRAAWRVPGLVSALSRRNRVDGAPLRQTLFGREIANPVGLAAGFDKNAEAVRALREQGVTVLVETKTEGGESPADRALAELGCEPISLSKYRVGMSLVGPARDHGPQPGSEFFDQQAAG